MNDMRIGVRVGVRIGIHHVRLIGVRVGINIVGLWYAAR